MPEEARAWQIVLAKIESDLLDGFLAPGDRLAPDADGVLRLSLAPEQEHLKSPSLVLQLGDAVASLLGGNVQLRLDVGAAPGETANARQSRERTLRQGQAERGFAEEPAIRRLVETRGAQIVPDSIRPLGDN